MARKSLCEEAPKRQRRALGTVWHYYLKFRMSQFAIYPVGQ